MANFTLQLTVGVAKGAAASWYYVSNSVGHSYGNPVDVQIGDTVTFTRTTSSGGTGKVRLLNIFTNNADIDLTASAPTVVRTIATGGTTLDAISGRNQGESVTDDFFLERQAASSDTTPTAFDFTNQTGVTRSSTRTSANTVTIAGMDSGVSTAVTISGGTYSKNGGSYTSASTTASNGTTFKVRHTSSSSYSTNTTTTLTVGGVAGSFVSTTEAAPSADTTPNAFNLNDMGPIAPGTVGTSTAVQITGMDANTPCSITGQGSPQLRVGGNSGTWTTSSTISPNFYINARLTAPTAYSSTHTATLTIGTVTDTITVTSQAAPSGSGGTGTTGGTGAYGIKVFDTNGSTSVISPSTRYMTRMTDATSISLAATYGSSILLSCDMTGLTTSNSDVIFEQFAQSAAVPVTRESNGFRVTNNTSAQFNNIIYAVRF